MSVSWQYHLPNSPAPAAVPNTRKKFSDGILLIVPPWLMRRVAGAVLFACALQLDDLVDRLVAGIKLRYPGLYSDDSLPLIGRERRIRRGRFETNATYAARLKPWLDNHAHRGGPYAMLGQIYAFFAPSSFAVELIYPTGRRFSMDVNGAVLMDDTTPWDAPGPPEKWAQYLLVYDWPDPVDDDCIWSDPGTWNDGGVWDSDLSPDDVRDIRLIPREWQNARSVGRVRLVSPLETIEISVD